MQLTREQEHALKNHLAIIIGFAELLVEEASATDPRRDDFVEIHKAAKAAIELVSTAGEPGR